MKHILCFLFILLTQTLFGQISKSLKNKWGFLGNGIVLFAESGDTLFADIMEQNTYRFIDVYNFGETENRKNASPVQIIDTVAKYQFAAAFKLNTFGTKLDTLQFWVDKKSTNQLNVVGSIVHDKRESHIRTNKSCDTTSPLSCSIILYDIAEFEKIKKLKPIETISKKDIDLFLTNFELALKTKCNLCSEPFFVSVANKIVIELGYNPIYTYNEAGQIIYKTSALYQLTFIMSMSDVMQKKRYNSIVNQFYGWQ